MNLDERKRMSRQALHMWDSDNTDDPRRYYARDYVNHQVPDIHGGVTDKNIDEWMDMLREFHDGFDAEIEVEFQAAEGDLVATRWKMTAQQTGPYLGRPATGKQLVWTGVAFDRYEGNEIVETWIDWDKFHLFEELGLVSARGA